MQFQYLSGEANQNFLFSKSPTAQFAVRKKILKDTRFFHREMGIPSRHKARRYKDSGSPKFPSLCKTFVPPS